jgi:hypothetical protein
VLDVTLGPVLRANVPFRRAGSFFRSFFRYTRARLGDVSSHEKFDR